MDIEKTGGKQDTASGEVLSVDSVQHARVQHDIRASLAISHGFNQALESSFAELCDVVQHVLGAHGETSSDDLLLARVKQLEADCTFCLSRLGRSLEQLDRRIDSAPQQERQQLDSCDRDAQ